MLHFLLAAAFPALLLATSPEPVRLSSTWPPAGPPILFEIKGLGNGYSSPLIASDRLYVTGETDSTGYLFSFDLKGKLIWKIPYGKEWTIQFPGPRSDPSVVDDLIYLTTGHGYILCLERQTGKKRWLVNMVNDLGGVVPTFGYSIPAIFDGDKLFCSPGGEKNNVVALDRFTGKLIWSSPGKGETAGYGTPLLIILQDRKILVTSSEFFILGLDASTGQLLWSYELAFKGEVPCNTPLFDRKNIYWIAGPGNGAVAAKLSPGGDEISVAWKNPLFDTFFGDFIHIGDHLYGSSDALRQYLSVNPADGTISDSLSFGIGSITRAGDMMIAYNQRGQVGLIRPEEGNMTLVSSYRVTKGTKEHFSHPVFHEGILFIRHGDVLLAFNLVANEQK
ncbi:MAG: PQQ-binding-like beta-propeller repeat protein [bacterium]